MSPEDHSILEEFAARVRELEPRARIWAFGSRARGTAHPESDFDLCIVVPERRDPLDSAIRDIAWEIGFERERVLTTVMLSAYDFEQGPMSASSLVANIRREGRAA
ncbi:MAG: nucleotidyltransferase domain-containing protein [Gemmatimonadetes bacterium]|nr:nucleotidyltransferase domain-containing protein [Gemmatimonadota bacterium]